jgi:RNA polymerase sigma-70 factor (ECF subfamily)
MSASVAHQAEHAGGEAVAAELTAALAGDHDAFRLLTEPYRRELHVHCYRLLGSFHDAEDALQDTLLRAWRHLASFEGRSSFRAWLYRIATNVCLTQHDRSRRQLPALSPVIAEALADAIARGTEPAINLGPYPDALLDELEATSGDPVAEAELRESVQLAFLAAVQLLPPRQRAALLLRDVVGFPAGAVAEMLDATIASVNSALKRARATLEQQRLAGRLHPHRAPPDDLAASMVQRYADAWQVMDVDRLVAVLKDDVVLSMPPAPLRYSGREAAASFYRSLPPGSPGPLRIIPTRANRQPAMAVYRRGPTGTDYAAWGVWVLTSDVDAIAEVTAFFDPRLFAVFGLPSELSE